MRRPLWMFVLVVLAAAASARAQGTTLLDFTSEPGDFIGQGQQFTFTPADGTITASRNFSNGVSISFNGAELWALELVAPGAAALQPGQYEEATRFPFQSPTKPGLSVTGDGRGCNTLTGRFVVLEAVYDAGGAVQQFAADYEQHCEGGAPALYGSVRINSTVTVEPRLSVGPATVYEGDTGTLQMRFVISLSAPAPGPVSVEYTTVDGTATGGADYTSVAGTANFPAGETEVVVMVAVAGDTEDEADETFTLSLQNPVGAPVAFDEGLGTIVDNDPLSTLLYFNSEPGDFIGQGQQFSFTPADGTITASRNFDNGITIEFDGADLWFLDFVAPGDAALQPGQYEGATRFPFQSPTRPGLDVSGDGRGCNKLTGRFVVLEVVYGAGGSVQKLAVDYEQHCEGGAPALYGSVRFNSAVPIEPRLSVGPARVYEGDAGTVQMRFVISLSAPAAGPVSVQYVTVSGTATGSDYTPVSGTANFPAGETEVVVLVPVAGDLVDEADETFALSLLSPTGAPVAFGQGLGTIVDDDPLKTLLYFNSQPGDFIGQGQKFTLTPVDGTFTGARNFDNGVAVDFTGENRWDTDFAAAGDVALGVGAYTGAVRFPFQPAGSHGMSITGASRGCNTLTGRFVVLEAVYGAGGAVQSFAADYEQHCEGGAAALFGSVRYNSSIPVAPRLFVGSASITEGNAGTAGLGFPVWLSEPLAAPASVSYNTVDGTAVGGVDYASASSSLNFSAGTVSATATIQVAGDLLDEPNETFEVVLSNPSGAALGIERGVGTIVDNDPAPQLTVGDVMAIEGDPGRPGTAGFAVGLNTPSGQSVCFNYSTLQDTAQVGVDFVNTFGSSCIPAGSTSLTVNVPLIGDLVLEAHETFSLTASGVTGATVADGQGTGTILNDDDPTDYYTVAPCRLLDTRSSLPGGVEANTILEFAVGGLCGVPITAKAVVVNVTIVGSTAPGSLHLFPAATPAPVATVLHFSTGRTIASNATVTLGADGYVAVQCDMNNPNGRTHVIVDVYGYFQ